MVIIAGLPRSGTSAIASIVSGLGVDLGPPFKDYRHWTPRGSFESHRLRNLFLFFRGHGCLHLEPLQKEFAGKKEPWGFKSHAYLPIARSVEFLLPKKTLVIHCARPVKECRESLHALGRKATEWWIEKEWGDGVKFLTATHPTLRVDFPELRDAAAVGKKIAEFLGLPYLPTCTDHVDFSLSKFSNEG